MNCIDNCKFINNDSERAIACRLCEKVFHLKCIKISVRLAESINSDLGIYWFCKDCRKINANMCSLFTETKKAYKDISADLAGIQEKFSKYENLFAKKLSLSDLSKLSEFKVSHEKQNLSVEVNDSPQSDNNLIFLSPVPENTSVQDIELPSLSKANSLQPPPVKVTNTLSLPNPFNDPPTTSNITVITKPIASTVPTLRVVVPRKTVFLSRLSEDTSEDNISDYIHSRLKTFKDFSVKKFKFSYKRQSSSFNISVPPNMLSKVVDKSFWPEGIIVHEFIHSDNKDKKKKKNNVVSLPNSTSNNSKN